MKDPTPFALSVMRIVGNGVTDTYPLTYALIKAGHGKHPAAVSMNITKLAWKNEYVTFCGGPNRAVMLTEAGKKYLKEHP